MCNDKLLRLKRNIEQRKANNLYYAKTPTTADLPPVKMSQVYAFLASEDNDIITMIDIIIGSDT
jgi:hypothetical protein